MMHTAKDFEEVRTSLLKQLDHEILNLKHWLESKTDEALTDNPLVSGEAVERIFNAEKGIEKLSNTLSFFDCWEENGDIPKINEVSYGKGPQN